MRWLLWSSASDGDPDDKSTSEPKQQQQQHSPSAKDNSSSQQPSSSSASSPPAGIRAWLASKHDWNSIVNATDWIQFTEARNIIPTALITGGILLTVHLHRKYLRRIPEVAHLTPKSFRRKSLLGRVTSVGDGDNFRLYHTPGGMLAGWEWLRKVPTTKKALRQETIHVRIAGVDAPELPHFGRPPQPFSQEAHTWLTNFLLHRRVRAYIYRPDQYARVVATVYVRRWLFFRQDVGLHMLKAGLATVYEAKSGAEFGGEKLEGKYRAAETLAKERGKGMWKPRKGKKAADGAAWESPRDYKTRMAERESGAKE